MFNLGEERIGCLSLANNNPPLYLLLAFAVARQHASITPCRSTLACLAYCIQADQSNCGLSSSTCTHRKKIGAQICTEPLSLTIFPKSALK